MSDPGSSASHQLQDNPSFNLFLDTDELFELAAARQWIVLAPLRSSLRYAKINLDFVRTHILRKSPYFKDKHCTLDGREVEFDGKSITTTPKDWPSERVVYVLEDELYYDSNFQSFRVLHISQPLIGRSSAPTSSSSSSSSSQSRDYPNELGGSGMLSASSSSHSLQRTKSEELKSGGGTGGGYSDGRSWDNSGRDSSSSGSGGGGGGGGDSGGGGGEHSFLNRMNSSPAQWRRCLHTLCGAPSPAVFGRNLLEPLRQYVQTFNDGFVLVKGERFMKLTAETLKTECGRLARTAIQASGRRLTPEEVNLFHTCVENLVLQGVYQKLFSSLKALYDEEEARLRELILSLQNTTMEELGIREEIICQPNLAIRRLALLDSRETPLGKLQLLHSVNLLLHRSVADQCSKLSSSSAVAALGLPPDIHPEGAGDPDGGGGGETAAAAAAGERVVLTSDDILPMTVFILIQAYTKTDLDMHLHANLLCMEHFVLFPHHPQMSQLRMHLANFTAALEFLRSGRMDRFRQMDGILQTANQANERLLAPTVDPLEPQSKAKMANVRNWGPGTAGKTLPRDMVGGGGGRRGKTAVDWRNRLLKFYRAYCPEKLPQMELTLEAFQGREQLLFDSLYEKYGLTWSEQQMWQEDSASSEMLRIQRSQTFGNGGGGGRLSSSSSSRAPSHQLFRAGSTPEEYRSVSGSGSWAQRSQFHASSHHSPKKKQYHHHQQQQQQQHRFEKPVFSRAYSEQAPEVIDLQDDLQGLIFSHRR